VPPSAPSEEPGILLAVSPPPRSRVLPGFFSVMGGVLPEQDARLGVLIAEDGEHDEGERGVPRGHGEMSSACKIYLGCLEP
jgi:hypothetical protein